MPFKFVLCDPAGEEASLLLTATNRRISVPRNDGREASLTISHYDSDAYLLFDLLANGTPQLRVYEDNYLWFSGFLSGALEDLELATPTSQINLTFSDPFGRMKGPGGRFVANSPTPTIPGVWSYLATDAGQIAWSLISRANTISPTGMRSGAIQATVLRDRSYDGDKNVSEAIIDLTQVINGFDFEIVPLDPTINAGNLGEFRVYSSQGQELPGQIFAAGQGTLANVDKVTRQTTPPVNYVRAVGTGTGLVSVKTDSTSIAKHGVWERHITASDVVEQSTLDAKALDEIRPEWSKTLAFDINSALAPRPIRDFWIGDRIPFQVREGSMRENLITTINGIAVTLDDSDAPTFTLDVEKEQIA